MKAKVKTEVEMNECFGCLNIGDWNLPGYFFSPWWERTEVRGTNSVYPPLPAPSKGISANLRRGEV
jgi:hypothetical protein